MGYRGSKSKYNFMPIPIQRSYKIYNIVKEQRVDGSCFGRYPKLRCTLMGGESRYQTNNPSNKIIIPTRNFCIYSKKKICKDLLNSYLDSPAAKALLLVSGQKDSSNKLAS